MDAGQRISELYVHALGSGLRKTALIVDDSKSARMVLKRLLESHELDVDTAESAEAALEYLIDHRPDVVFMDHMMPGMDGFEAVSAIKNNPDPATIPLMMYTSQEGELYVGQARALGAIGVLPKKVEPVEVSKVLRSLRVIGDEVERRRTLDTPVDLGSGEYPGIEKLDKSLKELIQDLFDQQRAVLRRDLLDSYEVIASRVADEIRPAQAEIADDPETGEADGAERFRRLNISVTFLAILVVIFASLFWLREKSWQNLQLENTALRNVVAQRSRLSPDGALADPGSPETFQDELSAANEAARSAIEWGANQSAAYTFDELPFGDSRLDAIEEVSQRLLEVGFRGLVRLESHVGDFCMIAIGPGTYELAPPEIDARQCDSIGFEPAEAIELGMRQSVAFANFVNTSSTRTQGRIHFEIVSLGNSEPAIPYPNSLAGITAGSWNDFSILNNRVQVSIYPE
jgi:CheY-like chemotaxis protein